MSIENKSEKKRNTGLYMFFGLIVVAGIYAYSQYSDNSRITLNTPTSVITTAMRPRSSVTSSGGAYTDGSYTGSAADAYYGSVQVEAIIRNGQLADVKFLQYPNSHSASVYINQQAMPYLTQEAIQAQSANVNGVSGATFTSQAFTQSLASALSQA